MKDPDMDMSDCDAKKETAVKLPRGSIVAFPVARESSIFNSVHFVLHRRGSCVFYEESYAVLLAGLAFIAFGIATCLLPFVFDADFRQIKGELILSSLIWFAFGIVACLKFKLSKPHLKIDLQAGSVTLSNGDTLELDAVLGVQVIAAKCSFGEWNPAEEFQLLLVLKDVAGERSTWRINSSPNRRKMLDLSRDFERLCGFKLLS